MKRACALFLLSVGLLIGCATADRAATTPIRNEAPAVQRTPTATKSYEEAYVAQRGEDDDIDSVLAYDGGFSSFFLLASARGKDQLHRFEAATGKYIESHGQSGSGLGQFSKPRGMATADALLFVVDSGNRRVQVYTLPRVIPQLSFGAEQLRNPVAVYVDGDGSGTYRVQVLDRVEGRQRLEAFEFTVQPIRRDVVVTRIEAEVRHLGGREFSATSPAGDPPAQFFADQRFGRVYHTDGERLLLLDRELNPLATGPSLPRLAGRPTGVTGMICPRRTDQGYIIIGEQVGKEQRFNVYTREDLSQVASFAGSEITQSSSVAMIDEPLAYFPAGAVFALSERKAIGALDWSTIAKGAAIRALCF